MGQLGCNLYLLAQAVLFQNLTQSRFAAGVNIGGVIVIDTQTDGLQNFSFRFLHVNSSLLPGKTHAAKSQIGYGIAVFVIAVIHGSASLTFLFRCYISIPLQWSISC